MAKVRSAVVSVTATVPMTFIRIDCIACPLLLVIELHAVENEELGFRAEVRNVGDAGALQITFSADGDIARIVGVTLSRNWIDCITHQTKRRFFGEWIHPD